MLAVDHLPAGEPAREANAAAPGPAAGRRLLGSFLGAEAASSSTSTTSFDAVHGGQQLRLFNARYDNYGFQPIVVFDGEGRSRPGELGGASRERSAPLCSAVASERLRGRSSSISGIGSVGKPMT